MAFGMGVLRFDRTSPAQVDPLRAMNEYYLSSFVAPIRWRASEKCMPAITKSLSIASLALLTALSLPASAQQLNVICPVQAEWCSLAATEFERETGIKVGLTLKGSGESFAQIAAEKANPKLDLWFGGTGDPHLQAAEQGLTDEYRSPMLAQLQPWAQKQAEQAKYRTVGLYLGVLGMGYNTELLARKKIAAPACWRDLVKPEFAGEVQMANPNASGTAYTAIATIVQVFGEEEGFQVSEGAAPEHQQLSRGQVSDRSRPWPVARRWPAFHSFTTS
jgi:iron(III) transport system substrate-binding protein